MASNIEQFPEMVSNFEQLLSSWRAGGGGVSKGTEVVAVDGVKY